MTTLVASTYPDTRERLLLSTGESSYRAHLKSYGPLPAIRRRDAGMLSEIAESGITGRGGAGFPTATKLAAVAQRRRTVVIANGTEGEPASQKDAVLLTHNPHLVLDGLAVAAGLVGARDTTIAVAQGTSAARSISHAIAERPEQGRPQLTLVADRFISGEESALVSAVDGATGLPTGRRPYSKGILVQNVETLANLGLIARYGAVWFREAGTEAEPGTALATVSGAVASRGVIEFEFGTSLGELFDQCGGVLEPVDAVLVGGYFGRWLTADRELELTAEALSARGGSLGARVIVALPRSACGLTELARVTRYLAGESAGQCGPCVFGLPALSQALDALRDGGRSDETQRRIRQLDAQIERRGACHHPDGTLGFVRSGLDVFADEVDLHGRGICSATTHAPILPTPRVQPSRSTR